ncbi:hypothetical protein J6590_063190 [Homalodisca vitripennis]|nr:hypothetical protein J6590_063190 [Homalodisca vitripennis]
MRKHANCSPERSRIGRKRKILKEQKTAQGSVLGAILFLIYINDLCLARLNGMITSFADDTALCYAGDNWDEQESNQRLFDDYDYWTRACVHHPPPRLGSITPSFNRLDISAEINLESNSE